MANLIMLAVCLAAGFALRSSGRVPENGHSTINGFIIHIALPALILTQTHGKSLALDMLLPATMPWFLFGLSIAVFVTISRLAKLSAGVTGALIMTAGLANTSFVGLPMIEAFYGQQFIGTGVLIDQLGTYLVLSTAGVMVAAAFSSEKAPRREIVTKIVTFPPLLALIIALATVSLPYPEWLTSLLTRLGGTLAPLALVSVGMQLRFAGLREDMMPLGLGLGFKLVLGPLLVALLFLGPLPTSGETARVTVFEAAMGPQIGGAIVAMQYGLGTRLIPMMVGMGIVLSFATLPLWYLGLEHF